MGTVLVRCGMDSKSFISSFKFKVQFLLTSVWVMRLDYLVLDIKIDTIVLKFYSYSGALIGLLFLFKETVLFKKDKTVSQAK